MKIHVTGMMCTHCKARVEKIALAQPGITAAEVNLKEESLTVEGTFDYDALKNAIEDADFKVAGVL